MNSIATSQSVARRRIEDRAGHHVVAARLEHQPFADPVIFGEEVRALLDHGRAVEGGAAAGDQPHRIAAGVAVDAEETVARHDGSPRSNTNRLKRRDLQRRTIPESNNISRAIHHLR